jgi:hypothetical protein
MKKLKVVLLCVLSFYINSQAQINFQGCEALFDAQTFTFNQVSVDMTGRHVFETTPIDGQPCSGIGTCEFRISWNDTASQWEFIADDGNGDFSGSFLIYTNSNASAPNPPSLSLGVWAEGGVTMGACGGSLTTANATMTGDVQETTLNVSQLELDAQLEIYPNPTTQFITIRSTNMLAIKDVEIYNVNGKIVLTTKIVSGQIDLSNLKSGFYFLKVNADKRSIYKKIIVE